MKKQNPGKKSRTQLKKIFRTNVYTITETVYQDGTSRIERRNEGFHAATLIGVGKLVMEDALQEIMSTTQRINP